LDFDEVRGFLHGKFGLDANNTKKVFDLHAHKHEKKEGELTMDFNEFKTLMEEANQCLVYYNRQEAELLLQNVRNS
jgi:hypothetical protein